MAYSFDLIIVLFIGYLFITNSILTLLFYLCEDYV
jgi:hypothetical protein